MELHSKSIRPFIGAKDFDLSRAFYSEIGFKERVLSPGFSVFTNGAHSFYLQDAYVEDWINNTMVFMEVSDVEKCWEDLANLNLPSKYKDVKLIPVRVFDWGKECYLHDPSGVLWHFGVFSNQK